MNNSLNIIIKIMIPIRVHHPVKISSTEIGIEGPLLQYNGTAGET